MVVVKNKIKEGIYNMANKQLDQMRESFNTAIAIKAVKKLEEKKIAIASTLMETS